MHVIWTLQWAQTKSYNGKFKSKLVALQNSSIMWQFEIIGIKWIRFSYDVLEPLGL
jgi:hypothetical protein